MSRKPGAIQGAMPDESFWIVRKPAQSSKVEHYSYNPIKTSYELLWAELRKPDPQNLTIQNTLRRILENYFKILGGIDLQNLWEHFEDEEAVHCRSLISWVNDGSHFAHDDLYVVIDEPMVDSYLKVFFKIFRQTKHMPHYQMMMGDQYVDLDPEVVQVSEAVAEDQIEPAPLQVPHELGQATYVEQEALLIDPVPPLDDPQIIVMPIAPSNEDQPF